MGGVEAVGKRNPILSSFEEKCGEEVMKQVRTTGLMARLVTRPEKSGKHAWRPDPEAKTVIIYDTDGGAAGRLLAYVAFDGVDITSPQGTAVEWLQEADKSFDAMEQRYLTERQSGLFPDTKRHMPKNKKGQQATKAKAARKQGNTTSINGLIQQNDQMTQMAEGTEKFHDEG